MLCRSPLVAGAVRDSRHIPAMTSTPAAISIEAVSKSHDDGRHTSLDRVSLGVARARIPRHRRAVGLRQDHAAAAGQPAGRSERRHRARRRRGRAERSTPIALRRRIGYVFQGIGLFPHMTVAENIAITPQLLGWDAARMAARVDELLELVRLDRDKHRDRFPRSFPAAKRQRVGVARALAAEPAHRADGRAVRRARSADPRRARRGLPAAARRARPHHRDDHPRHAGSRCCSPTASR